MNTAAIIGRPNVGKSTLFNRLLNEKLSIVDREPGVTRDRVYGVFERDDIPVIIIDTGGLQFSGNEISSQIRKQVDFALEEADIILMMVDGRQGLTPLDKEISEYIRRYEGDKALVINKMDEGGDWRATAEFSELVFDETFQISSMHGQGVNLLLSWMLGKFEKGELVRGKTIGVIGKPNTGKSTLVNAIMGYERSIIKEEPGTTRDSINSYFAFRGENIVLVDTAGLKKKSSLKDSLEYYSFLRAIRSIEKSDVVLILIDSTEKVTRQDKRIINWAIERDTPFLIILSKFDIVPEEKEKEVIDYYSNELHFASYSPFIPVSSITGRGIEESLSTALHIERNANSDHPELEEVIREACRVRPPGGTAAGVKIYNVNEEKGRIWIYADNVKSFDREYRKYLRNRIREKLGFEGIPIKISIKRGKGRR